MKLLEELIYLAEASFSAKNFPEEGNEEFSGAGERTNYIQMKINDSEGFPLLKNVKVLDAHGRVSRELPAGTRVFIIRPGRLVRGAHINAASSIIYTGVGLRSAGPKSVIGFVPISSIQKPSKGGQSRILKGKAAQDNVASALQSMFDDVEILSSAVAGSKGADVRARVNGKEIQFEVKGRDSKSAPITLFDRSARRGKPEAWLDHAASIITNGKLSSFEKLVDKFKKQDPTIGYPGDEGVIKSGKLPSAALKITDPARLSQFKQELIGHFREGGDNYFAVEERSAGKINVYHVYGPNPLKAPKLPDLKEFSLDTYGGSSSGAMRVGTKIKLHPGKTLELSTSKPSEEKSEDDTDE